ncbi:hypothetical protein ACUOFC_60010, partial [Escherichia sp. TWPC-MK]
LRQWVNESGIRWGIDDDNVRELELPTTGQHTWRFGLTRMLLGYAMESAQGEWQSIHHKVEPIAIARSVKLKFCTIACWRCWKKTRHL